MRRCRAILLIALLCGHAPLFARDAGAVDVAGATVRLALAEEPASLDSRRATDQASSFVLGHVNEGLLGYDAAGRLAPAVAVSWEADARGARFHLRPDARWADGVPVTAHDFVHAWRALVDPATAAPYAALLFPLANARAIVAGEMPPESLGVVAHGDHELELRCSEPCAHLPALTAYKSLYPLRADFVQAAGSRFASSPETLLANGPFRLRRWVRGAEIVLERNPAWRAADTVRLARIEIPYITSSGQAELNLFLDQRIALANVPPDALSTVLARRLHLQRFVDGYVAFLVFNFRDGRPTRNRALRRAIQAAIDPAEIVDRVLRVPGMLPGDSLFPVIFRGERRAFTRERPLPVLPRGDAVAAGELAVARRELGVTRLRPLHLLTGEAPQSARVGEYLQARLAAIGIEVLLDRQITRQRLAQMERGDFDIAVSNWGPDFDDPLTFAALPASWNPINRGHYADPACDALVRALQQETLAPARHALMDRLQQRVQSEVPLLPLYQNARLYVQHPALRGLVRSRFGADPDLRGAWLDRGG